jgi:hypothetical protein
VRLDAGVGEEVRLDEVVPAGTRWSLRKLVVYLGRDPHRLIESFGSCAGRRDDKLLVLRADPAGTATRPLRVQTG